MGSHLDGTGDAIAAKGTGGVEPALMPGQTVAHRLIHVDIIDIFPIVPCRGNGRATLCGMTKQLVSETMIV